MKKFPLPIPHVPRTIPGLNSRSPFHKDHAHHKHQDKHQESDDDHSTHSTISNVTETSNVTSASKSSLMSIGSNMSNLSKRFGRGKSKNGKDGKSGKGSKGRLSPQLMKKLSQNRKKKEEGNEANEAIDTASEENSGNIGRSGDAESDSPQNDPPGEYAVSKSFVNNPPGAYKHTQSIVNTRGGEQCEERNEQDSGGNGGERRSSPTSTSSTSSPNAEDGSTPQRTSAKPPLAPGTPTRSRLRASKSKSSRHRKSPRDASPTASEQEQTQAVPPPPSNPPESFSPSQSYYALHGYNSVANAPLTPLEAHFQTNHALHSLFSTLYERSFSRFLQSGDGKNGKNGKTGESGDGHNGRDDESVGSAKSRSKSGTETDDFTIAYAVGLRFVEVALFQIPKHGYYHSEKYEEERKKNAADAWKVTKLLGEMVEELDEEPQEEKSNDDGSVTSVQQKKEKLKKLAMVAQQSFEDIMQKSGNDVAKDDNEAEKSKSEVAKSFPDSQGDKTMNPNERSIGGNDNHANNDDSNTASNFWTNYVVPNSDTMCSFWEQIGNCGGGMGGILHEEPSHDVVESTDPSSAAELSTEPFVGVIPQSSTERSGHAEETADKAFFGKLDMSTRSTRSLTDKIREKLRGTRPEFVGKRNSEFSNGTTAEIIEERLIAGRSEFVGKRNSEFSNGPVADQTSGDLLDKRTEFVGKRTSEFSTGHAADQVNEETSGLQQRQGVDTVAKAPSSSVEYIAPQETLVSKEPVNVSPSDETSVKPSIVGVASSSAESVTRQDTSISKESTGVSAGETSVQGESTAGQEKGVSISKDESKDDWVVVKSNSSTKADPMERSTKESQDAQSIAEHSSAHSSQVSVTTEPRTVASEPTDNASDKNELKIALSMSMKDNLVITSSKDASDNEGFVAVTSVDISSLSELYRDQFMSLRDKEKFHVRFLDTFQGRYPGSTNGCTVIAPLTCIQYFTADHQMDSQGQHIWKLGLPDDSINQVIDIQAPAILPEIRSKLDLAPDSFIIPADVHDHLMNEGLLTTSQFVGVCGGNILDDDHLAQLKSTLLVEDPQEKERLKGKKIAAALFFHGHVVALHLIHSEDGIWVEMIDSLPNAETWMNRPTNDEERNPAQASIRLGGSVRLGGCPSDECESDWEQTGFEEKKGQYGDCNYTSFSDEDEFPQNAVRVRCTDMEHFDTLIRHYACSKFSDQEQKFINENAWSDNNSYFDPRVFQAFVWAEA